MRGESNYRILQGSRWRAACTKVAADRLLLQGAVDGGEFGVQLRADALDRGNDRQRDTAGDEAIFNRSSAGLICQEF
jgi:hypothetical protein